MEPSGIFVREDVSGKEEKQRSYEHRQDFPEVPQTISPLHSLSPVQPLPRDCPSHRISCPGHRALSEAAGNSCSTATPSLCQSCPSGCSQASAALQQNHAWPAQAAPELRMQQGECRAPAQPRGTTFPPLKQSIRDPVPFFCPSVLWETQASESLHIETVPLIPPLFPSHTP